MRSIFDASWGRKSGLFGDEKKLSGLTFGRLEVYVGFEFLVW